MGVLLSCGDFYPIFVDVLLEKSDFLESVRRENDFVFASFLIKIPENIILEFLSGDCQIICFDRYQTDFAQRTVVRKTNCTREISSQAFFVV